MSDVRRQKKLFSTQFEVRQSFLLTNYEFRLTGLVKRSTLWEKNIKIGRFTGRCFRHGRYLGGVLPPYVPLPMLGSASVPAVN